MKKVNYENIRRELASGPVLKTVPVDFNYAKRIGRLKV